MSLCIDVDEITSLLVTAGYALGFIWCVMGVVETPIAHSFRLQREDWGWWGEGCACPAGSCSWTPTITEIFLCFLLHPPPLPPLLTSMDSSEHFTQCPDLWATTQLSVFCTVAGLVVATHSYCEHLFSLFNWQTRQCWDQNHNLEKQKKCNCSHMKWKKHTKIVPKRWPFHGAYHCYTNYENKKNNEEKTQHLAEPVTTHVRGREHNSICFMFFSLYLVH